MKNLIVILLLCLTVTAIRAQEEDQIDRLKVFVDCANTRCYDDYFRSEINLVDFYRDQIQADVFVLITSNRNASQGRTIQMILYGQNQLSSIADTITYSTEPNASDFQQREAMTLYLKLGLAPFIAKTKSASQVDIVMKSQDEPLTGGQQVIPEDKWNYWVFFVEGEGGVELNRNREEYNYQFSGSANQIKPNHRISFRAAYEQNINVYNYFDDGNNTNKPDSSGTVNNYEINAFNLYVRGLSDHWSLGYFANFRSNTFRNIQENFQLSPALEYSIFPYDEFNNRLLTLRYEIGLNHFNFVDTTIYNQITQTLPQHRLRFNADFNQRWGNIRTGITYQHYLHDTQFYQVSIFSRFEVRVTGNLSFNFFVFGEIDRAQINLAKGGDSEVDLLTRRRELQSNFNVDMRFGINYRFGSQLNNFVNPRFDVPRRF